MGEPDRHEAMRAIIVRYFEACNRRDADGIAACLTPDAVHYFPPGMYGGAFRGARAVAERWTRAHDELGSRWVLETVSVDAVANTAVAEWTHYKTRQGTVLRGDEWYEFDEATGRIREIRAYYAAPQAAGLARSELAEFDYAGRGYSLEPAPDA